MRVLGGRMVDGGREKGRRGGVSTMPPLPFNCFVS